MTQPQLEKNNLRQSLSLLRKKGLVEMVNVDSQTNYYHLSQALPTRNTIADNLKVSPNEIIQPLLRKQDWRHNQWCEFWALSIKRIFPEAQIIREHDIESNSLAKSVLNVGVQDKDLLPDFLLTFPQSQHGEKIHIAFEIERTRKTDARLLRKLKKYLNRTKIDGLIYICDSGRLSETIRQLYQNKITDKSQRVGQYANNFFLFSDSFIGGGPKLDRLLNANGEPVNFENWCNYFRTVKWTLRRDKHLAG